MNYVLETQELTKMYGNTTVVNRLVCMYRKEKYMAY